MAFSLIIQKILVAAMLNLVSIMLYLDDMTNSTKLISQESIPLYTSSYHVIKNRETSYSNIIDKYIRGGMTIKRSQAKITGIKKLETNDEINKNKKENDQLHSSAPKEETIKKEEVFEEVEIENKDETDVLEKENIVPLLDLKTKSMSMFRNTGKVINELNDNYTKTDYSIYFKGTKIQNVDIETFGVLGAYYAKDKNNVYFGNKKINNADPNNFEIIDSYYTKDFGNVYYLGSEIGEADNDTFEIMPWLGLARDENMIYYFGVRQNKINAETFEIVDSEYARDEWNIYYANTKEETLIAKKREDQLWANNRAEDPMPTPEKVKGIYVSAYTFSRDHTRQKYINFLKNTELNALVIDIKGSDGYLMFEPENEKLKEIPQSSMFAVGNDEYREALAEMQEHGIYTIARIVTFQDPVAAKSFPELVLKNKQGNVWKSWNGVSWLDMTLKEAWEIPVLQAKEAIALGFDEIQFDYIRFPSDGPMKTIEYANFPDDKVKYEILRDFYAYLSKELRPYNIPLSVDLFGLTYQVYDNPEHALGIGQRTEDAALYFDYISPMVYPSHYGTGHFGLKSPVNSPYSLVAKSMEAGNVLLERTKGSIAKSRPWLQDFNMGATYDAAMVRAQIKACDDNNTAGWILWNARNVYTSGALKPAPEKVIKEKEEIAMN